MCWQVRRRFAGFSMLRCSLDGAPGPPMHGLCAGEARARAKANTRFDPERLSRCRPLSCHRAYTPLSSLHNHAVCLEFTVHMMKEVVLASTLWPACTVHTRNAQMLTAHLILTWRVRGKGHRKVWSKKVHCRSLLELYMYPYSYTTTMTPRSSSLHTSWPMHAIGKFQLHGGSRYTVSKPYYYCRWAAVTLLGGAAVPGCINRTYLLPGPPVRYSAPSRPLLLRRVHNRVYESPCESPPVCMSSDPGSCSVQRSLEVSAPNPQSHRPDPGVAGGTEGTMDKGAGSIHDETANE